MPKTTKATAPVTMENPAVVDRTFEAEGGYTLNFTDFHEDLDMTEMLAPLPGGMCQCPHWGYMLSGRFDVRYADGSNEVIEAGDAFYMPAGHVGTISAGTAFVMFSPTDEAKATEDAIAAAMEAETD